MFSSESLFFDSQTALEERLCLRIFARQFAELRQAVETWSHILMFGAKRLLSDGLCAPEQRLCIGILCFVPIKFREFIERRGRFEMTWTMRPLEYRKCSFK